MIPFITSLMEDSELLYVCSIHVMCWHGCVRIRVNTAKYMPCVTYLNSTNHLIHTYKDTSHVNKTY